MKHGGMTHRRVFYIWMMKVLMWISAGLTTLLVLFLIGYVFIKGLPNISFELLTTSPSYLADRIGILPDILNTIYIVLATLLIVLPLGVGAAIYLTEYAANKKLVTVIEYAAETLSGIPSIIFGLFGMVFFGNALGLGYSILTGALTLTIMILPLITRTTQEALKTVPDSYRHGALGIGATKWYMIRTILLPSAMPGILTGIILAIGRIVGESAALLFTAGSGYYLPKNLFSKIFESGGTLTIQLYLFMQKAKYNEAFGVAVVLLVIVLGINGLAKYMSHRFNVEAGA